MKPAPRTAPVAAALRVKDLARDLATDLADGYRRSTRFFKLRIAVIGSFAVLSLFTFWLACPPGGPSNSLGAEVQLSDGLMGTQLLVYNSSGRIWTDVTLTLDGGYEWQTPTFRDGQRMVIAASRFTHDGGAAPQNLRPKSLSIQCAQGSVTASLSARPP
jgi:hypothetical protein